MVYAIKGLFISCDAPMAELIVTLNDSMPESDRFIMSRLDDTHMYVLPHAAPIISREIAEFTKRNLSKPQQKKKSTVKSQDA